jgi:hypothetical protein
MSRVTSEKGAFEIGNGMNTRFWDGTWLWDNPTHPYTNIVQHTNVTTANVMSTIPFDICSRRALTVNKWDG